MTPQEKNTLIEGLIEKHQVHGALNGGMGQRLYSAMSELIDLLEPKWVSVEDKLKPDSWKRSVLLYTLEYENVTTGCYSNGAWHKYDETLLGTPTHWCLIPSNLPIKPPKQ